MMRARRRSVNFTLTKLSPLQLIAISTQVTLHKQEDAHCLAMLPRPDSIFDKWHPFAPTGTGTGSMQTRAQKKKKDSDKKRVDELKIYKTLLAEPFLSQAWLLHSKFQGAEMHREFHNGDDFAKKWQKQRVENVVAVVEEQ